MPNESITTWDQLKQAFLHKYFPPHKTTKFRNEITTFKQNGSETIYSAWERFKELQRQCPHHGLPEWMIPQIFYNGLTDENRNIVNAASGGKWMDKIAREAITLLEELASQGYMGEETTMAKARGVLELDTINMLSAKVDALTKMVSKSQVNSLECTNLVCETCGGPHSYSQCNMSANEDMNYIQGGFNQKVGLNSNSYNPQWRNHPGFSWSNTSSQLNPQINPNTKPQNPPRFPTKQ